jgi:hypothetical protein
MEKIQKCIQQLSQETCREGTHRRLRRELNNNNKKNICVKEIGSLERFCESSTILKAATILDKQSDYQPLSSVSFLLCRLGRTT